MSQGQDPGRGTMILVLGILSLVCCPLIGPVAWMMGKGDLAKVRAGEISQEAEGMTKIGMILGIVGTIFLIIDLLIGCVYGIIMVLAVIAAGSATTIKKTSLAIEPLFALLS